jgi:hypothetical protein
MKHVTSSRLTSGVGGDILVALFHTTPLATGGWLHAVVLLIFWPHVCLFSNNLLIKASAWVSWCC